MPYGDEATIHLEFEDIRRAIFIGIDKERVSGKDESALQN
jgi:hypothetical protein